MKSIEEELIEHGKRINRRIYLKGVFHGLLLAILITLIVFLI